ncbi:MAG: hypothetical protein U0324_34940 [Polyangiales bacterium]
MTTRATWMASLVAVALGCSNSPTRIIETDTGNADAGLLEDVSRDAVSLDRPQDVAPTPDRPEPVRTVRTVIAAGAPMDAPMRFGGSETMANAPTWVYPEDRTIVPPNLTGFELHYTAGQGNDLFEVSFTGDAVIVKVYAVCTVVGGGCALTFPQETFDLIANAGRSGGGVRMVIRGTSRTAMGGAVARSAERFLGFTQTDLRAGVYYWAAGSATIVRYEFGGMNPRPEVFLRADADLPLCVGCHALSRDGRRMVAGSSIPGPARARIIDVATRERPGAAMALNFGSFSPDNRRFLASDGMRLALYDGETGAPMGGVPAGSAGSHPDWAPNGLSAVYSRSRATIPFPIGTPGHDGPSDLMVMNWNVSTFGPSRTLVESMGENNYYPSYSPDGQWVLFNRATANSNNAPDAALWAVRADGSGQPIALTNANGRDATWNNSWPKWTPFVERYVGELEEPLLWITFSSTRDYGLRLRQGSQRRAQLWMAAFRPRGAAMDPTSPAFWLPFQNIDDSNHIPQWVEVVRRMDCTMDRNCPAGETCVNGRCAGAPP